MCCKNQIISPSSKICWVLFWKALNYWWITLILWKLAFPLSFSYGIAFSLGLWFLLIRCGPSCFSGKACGFYWALPSSVELALRMLSAKHLLRCSSLPPLLLPAGLLGGSAHTCSVYKLLRIWGEFDADFMVPPLFMRPSGTFLFNFQLPWLLQTSTFVSLAQYNCHFLCDSLVYFVFRQLEGSWRDKLVRCGTH